VELVLSATELDADEGVGPLVEAARRTGVDWVELWHPASFQAQGVPATLARLRAAGLRVACVSSGTELGREGDVSDDRRVLLEALSLAHDTGAPLVNTYFGYRARRDDAEAVEAYRDALAPCLREAERLGVAICLENEFDGFGHDSAGSDPTRRPEAFRTLLEAVDSPRFRVTFDPTNAYFAGVEPFPHAYDVLRPWIGYVHLKDGRRLPDTGADPRWKRFHDEGRAYVTAALGEGAVDWAGLLRRLRRDGYGGFLTLEPHAVREHRDAAWDQAAAAALRWIHETTGEA
jgi:sugar phosphate isomerase/epimerase